jgi:endonuclease V-like protein UPF0215 family
MFRKHFSHAIGFDDAPFDRAHRGDVLVVGTVYAGSRLDGVLTGKVRRDGVNSTRVLAGLIKGSRFRAHVQVVLLQGIALAGFNVVDIHGLHAMLGIPVIVVSRHRPDLTAIRKALFDHVPGGERKWKLIERAGAMEHVAGVYVQRAGVSLADTQAILKRFAIHGNVPEPLRVAHMIAGGIMLGESSKRV